MECLQQIDTKGLLKRGRVAVGQIEEFGYVLRSKELEAAKRQVGFGSAQIAGGIMSGLGVSKYQYISTLAPYWTK